MLRLALLAITFAAFSGVGVAVGHTGTHKALWGSRWDLQVQGGDCVAWMTLQTDKHACTGTCGSETAAPVSAAIADWNASDTTVYYSVEAAHQANNHVHVYTLGDNSTNELGWTQVFELVGGAYVECPDATASSCDVAKARVTINNWAHNNVCVIPPGQGPPCEHLWDSASQRQGTAVHELGHVISLAHEWQSCAQGDNPPSVMSYNCINPVEWYDGWAINQVRSWDECGVNHAYLDPNRTNHGC